MACNQPFISTVFIFIFRFFVQVLFLVKLLKLIDTILEIRFNMGFTQVFPKSVIHQKIYDFICSLFPCTTSSFAISF